MYLSNTVKFVDTKGVICTEFGFQILPVAQFGLCIWAWAISTWDPILNWNAFEYNQMLSVSYGPSTPYCPQNLSDFKMTQNMV